MLRARGLWASRSFALWASLIAGVGCEAKAQVVCDELHGCGLLSTSTEACVQSIRRGFAEDGVDGPMLTLCIDCASLKFCSELRQGLCEQSCAEVLAQLRESGIASASPAGSPAPAAPDAGR